MSIQMLTEHIGVAKGTFYHYFKSKEDLLTQWVLHEMEPIIEQHQKIAEDSDIGALRKFNMIFEQSRKWKLQHLDLILSLMRVLHDDHNLRLRVELNRQSERMSKGIFQKIIEQGVDEGVFDNAFPEEIANKLPQISQLFSEDLSLIILNHYEGNGVSLTLALRWICGTT